MANQYQIYGASLAGMCNMYRYANDSEELFAFGEMANKINNFHKDPIYPAGCSIINSYWVSNLFDYVSNRSPIQKLPESQHGSSDFKISEDGSANTFLNYQYVRPSSGVAYYKLNFYSDAPIYMPRYVIGSEEYLTEYLTPYINCTFLKGYIGGDGFSRFEEPSFFVSEQINFKNFPNIANITYWNTINNEQIEYINNSKITFFHSHNNQPIIPKYSTLFPSGSMDWTGVNVLRDVSIPSTAYRPKNGIYGDYFNNVIFESPYLARGNFSDTHRKADISLCDDVVINNMQYWWYNTTFKNFPKNIYIMPKTNMYYTFYGARMSDNNSVHVNFRGYNNEMIVTQYFLSFPGKIFKSINVESDIYLYGGGHYFCYTDGSWANELPVCGFEGPFICKNIYSNQNIYCDGLMGWVSSENNRNYSQIKKGFYAENIKANSVNIYISPSNVQFTEFNDNAPLHINGIVYANNYLNFTCYLPRTMEVGNENYYLKMFSEKNMDIMWESSYYHNFYGNYYFYVNATSGSNFRCYFKIGKNSKSNFFVNRTGIGQIYEYHDERYGTYYTFGEMRLYPNVDGFYFDGLKKINDSCYCLYIVPSVKIFLCDSCPFEVNKEIPNPNISWEV